MHQVRPSKTQSLTLVTDLDSIWKPLWGPLTDWPLAVCDTESVRPIDLIASDVVTRTGFTENTLVYFNPRHKWYYLSNQTSSELMIFRQADTQVDSQIGRFQLFLYVNKSSFLMTCHVC